MTTPALDVPGSTTASGMHAKSRNPAAGQMFMVTSSRDEIHCSLICRVRRDASRLGIITEFAGLTDFTRRAARVASLALAPTSTLALFRCVFRPQHVLALLHVGVLEAIPPLGKAREFAFHLAALAAQPQEIVARAKARMLEQPKGTLARALLESRLQ